ncbi:MAG: DNA polymerase III subunit delta [Anaerolineaceae bacterium]
MADTHLYLLRGDDRHAIAQHILRIQEGLGADFDPAMNLQHLDGKSASAEEIRTAVSTLPFFGTARLVLLENFASKTDKSHQDSFVNLLSAIPPSTHLVITAEDHQKWRRVNDRWEQVWETFSSTHWLVKEFSSRREAAILDAGVPELRQMPQWILNEAKNLGGRFDAAAASELTQQVGNDTSVASQEILKLLTYVDLKRPVTREDVLELVSVEGTPDVFLMLDRLMNGQTRDAQLLMHQLLDDSQPAVILGAVIHRFRQLLLVNEILAEGENLNSVAPKIGILPRKAEDYARAAKRYGKDRLEQIYRHLLEIDLQAKTSEVDLAGNLEVFILKASL